MTVARSRAKRYLRTERSILRDRCNTPGPVIAFSPAPVKFESKRKQTAQFDFSFSFRHYFEYFHVCQDVCRSLFQARADLHASPETRQQGPCGDWLDSAKRTAGPEA